MLQFGLFFVLIAATNAAYSSAGAGAATSSSSGLYNNIDSSSSNYGSQYPYANNFAGYVGGSAGVGQYPVYSPLPFVPFAGVPNPYDFNLALNQYFQSLQANFANSAATHVYAGPGASGSATASLTGPAYDYQNRVDSNDLYAQQFAQQAAIQNAIIQQASYGGAGYGGGAQYAGSSASYGPGGVYQTASIYPHNPNRPNIDTRFGDDGSSSVTYTSGGPGVHGVSTSSFVASSDVNGHKTGIRESVTSVNNNGKVTTYRVRN